MGRQSVFSGRIVPLECLIGVRANHLMVSCSDTRMGVSYFRPGCAPPPKVTTWGLCGGDAAVEVCMRREKTIGKPCAGNPHARFEGGPQETGPLCGYRA